MHRPLARSSSLAVPVPALALGLALAATFPGTAAAQDAAPDGPARDGPATLALGEGSLELRAAWETLTDTVYGFEQRPLVRDLRPAVERARYDAARFRPLLPAGPVAVGDTWRIDVDSMLPFLRQLHAGATGELHHDGGFGLGAHGAFACLAALDEGFAEIRLRVHADFLIDGDGGRPTSSWFTPAQFAGRFAIDRRRSTVVAFELAVPQQGANVDVNVADGKGGVSADIGRVPRMELRGGAFPELAATAARLAPEAAADLLARQFYPFAALDWLDLPAARAESRATGKPLHVIALFGSLMDESC